MKKPISLFIVAFSLFATSCFSTSEAETQSPTPKFTENEKINQRRQIAAGADGHFGVTSTLEGSDQTVLVLTTQTWAKLLADKYMSNSWATVDFDKAGLKTVIFRSRDHSPEIMYDVATRSFVK